MHYHFLVRWPRKFQRFYHAGYGADGVRHEGQTRRLGTVREMVESSDARNNMEGSGNLLCSLFGV